MAGKRLKQAVSDSPSPEAAILPQPVSGIPWGHNIVLAFRRFSRGSGGGGEECCEGAGYFA
jgi:hypothetical protein